MPGVCSRLSRDVWIHVTTLPVTSGSTMRRRTLIRVSLASLLLASPAIVSAQGMSADQTLNGSYSAQNIINMGSGTSGHDQRYLNAGAPSPNSASITQDARNLGNVIQFESLDFGTVSQHATVDQTAQNTAQLPEINELRQTGNNAVNLVTANSIRHLDQVMEGSTQSVTNIADAPILSGSVRQSGTNMANVASASDTLLATFQNFDEASEQSIVNSLTIGGGRGAVTQEGVNIGNFIDAHNVDEIVRQFSGSQIIDNILNINTETHSGTIRQSGTNIANYVRATGGVSKITQTSSGEQIVRNEVRGNHNGAAIRQTSINIVNLTETNVLGGGAAVSQTNSTTQTHQGGSANASQTGNLYRASN